MTTFELKANVKKLLAKVIRLENPTVLTQEPTVAGLIPSYIGQIVSQPNASRIWVADTLTTWKYITLT